MKKKSFNDFVSKAETLQKTMQSCSEELQTLEKGFSIFEEEAEEEAKTVASKHNKEIASYEKMLKMAKDGNMSTVEIDQKIKELKNEKESCDYKTKKRSIKESNKFNKAKKILVKKIEKVGKEIENQQDFMHIQKYAKPILDTTDYYEVESMEEILQILEIKIVTDKFNGDIKTITLNKGSLQTELKVEASSGRCLNTYLPPQIKWLPDDWAEIERDGVEATKTYYDEHTLDWHKTISPKLEFADEEYPQLFFDTVSQTFIALLKNIRVIRPFAVVELNKGFPMRFSQVFSSPEKIKKWKSSSQLASLYTEFIKNEDILNLNKEYPEGSLLKYIKDVVVNNTVLGSDSPFNESDDSHLLSQEIFLKFEKNWNKFVKGPWMPEMEGMLARLKYYCENRENPRFYNNGVKDSYGFRLRTRDHSWIKGTIYLLPEEKDDSDIIEVRKDEDGYKFKIGRMCVYLSEETRDHYK